MQMNKEELKAKISELGIDDEIKISLLEDVEDSFAEKVETEDVKESEDYKAKYDELKAKYIERFTKSEDIKEEDDSEDKKDELKEEEIIDVKEI